MDTAALNEKWGIASRFNILFPVEVEYHSSFQYFHDLIVILIRQVISPASIVNSTSSITGFKYSRSVPDTNDLGLS
jgi:hypothetical protein